MTQVMLQKIIWRFHLVTVAHAMLFLTSLTGGVSISLVAREIVFLAVTYWFLILKDLGERRVLEKPRNLYWYALLGLVHLLKCGYFPLNAFMGDCHLSNNDTGQCRVLNGGLPQVT